MIPEDIPILWEMFQNPVFQEWGCQMKESLEEELEAFPSYREYMYGLCDMGFWTVIRKDTGEVIGRVGFEPHYIPETGETLMELGYLIGLPYQGQGFAYEACQTAIEAAREREIASLYCRIHKDNRASAALAGKLGFYREGELWKKEIKIY